MRLLSFRGGLLSALGLLALILVWSLITLMLASLRSAKESGSSVPRASIEDEEAMGYSRIFNACDSARAPIGAGRVAVFRNGRYLGTEAERRLSRQH